MAKRVRRSKVDLDAKLKELARLAALEPSNSQLRCLTCQHEEAAALVAGFFERKLAGKTSISFKFFYDGCLTHVPGYKATYATALTHIRRHLGVDPLTGKPR